MRFIILLLTCLMATPAMPQDQAATKEELVHLLTRLDEIVPVRDEFAAMGFEGDNLALALAQHRRLFGDPQIAGYMADRLISAHGGALPDSLLMGGLLGPLIDRGIGHLPTAELAYFYRVENTVFGALPFRECGLAVKRRLPEQSLSDATARAAARLNTPALREYYRIQYKAARLGLTREAKTLSARDSAAVEASIAERLFQQDKAEQAEDMLRVFAHPGLVSNRAACEAGRLVMDTILTLEGDELRRALIYFGTP